MVDVKQLTLYQVFPNVMRSRAVASSAMLISAARLTVIKYYALSVRYGIGIASFIYDAIC